ncbi:MAG: type II secretion system F family protein [Planctomycetes bacterium]|nr:type II secretion system F family protein [Planctomycetota bacterium]
MPTAPPITPLPGFAGILRRDETFSNGDPADVADRLNGGFDRLMVQSGVKLAPSVFLLVCVFWGITAGGAAFVVQEHLLSAAAAGVVGAAAPLLYAFAKRQRRQKQMLAQMPEVVDELARAARTGRSLPQCLEVVAGDTAAPLGDELKYAVRRLRMGISPAEAVADLPDRTGLVSMRVLATALSVHHQTGGDLVTVLERLARTIRDRITFLGRVRTATSASRATAIMMLLLPPGIVAFFSVRDPEYLSTLMNSAWGRSATIAAIALQAVGTVWVLRILKYSRRT